MLYPSTPPGRSGAQLTQLPLLFGPQMGSSATESPEELKKQVEELKALLNQKDAELTLKDAKILEQQSQISESEEMWIVKDRAYEVSGFLCELPPRHHPSQLSCFFSTQSHATATQARRGRRRGRYRSRELRLPETCNYEEEGEQHEGGTEMVLRSR